MNIFMKMEYIFIIMSLSILTLGMNTVLNTDWSIVSFYKLLMEHSSTLSEFTYMFILLIMFITSLILVYSMSYMNKNNLTSYLLLMTLFAMSMLMFIGSTNIFSVMLGWDGLGVTSFFLVFFFSSNNSISPSVMTIMMNRVGDVCLIISILLIKGSFHSFSDIWISSSKILWLFIIMTSLTKSAQYPFSAWLPAAMAAPTPTSALVHSSTLVTAGVFLLAQNSEYLSSDKKNTLMMVAGITLVMASVATLSNWDLKKIIALSTLSQMSLLFLMLVSLDKKILMNHLLNHAIFKALLFMSAGWIIYQSSDMQEMRHINMSYISDPFILSSYFISIFSLMGLPFSASHYSKHYFVTYLTNSSCNYWMMFNTFMMLLMTLVYSVKLYMLSSFSMKVKTFKSKSPYKMNNFTSKSLKYMTYSSLISGLILNYMFMSMIKMYPEKMNFKYFYIYIIIDVMYMTYYLLMSNKTLFMLLYISYQQILTYTVLKLGLKILKVTETTENIWAYNQINKVIMSMMVNKSLFSFMTHLSLNTLMIYMIMMWVIFML